MHQNKEVYKNRLLAEMTRHIGKARAIPMTRLYRVVFEDEHNDKINDTRKLRDLITELKRDGVPIASMRNKNAGGYYLPGTAQELTEYCDGIKREALKKLAMVARLKEMALPALLGQMELELEELYDGNSKGN